MGKENGGKRANRVRLKSYQADENLLNWHITTSKKFYPFPVFSQNHEALKCIKKITGTIKYQLDENKTIEALFLRKPLQNKAGVCVCVVRPFDGIKSHMININ